MIAFTKHIGIIIYEGKRKTENHEHLLSVPVRLLNMYTKKESRATLFSACDNFFLQLYDIAQIKITPNQRDKDPKL